MKKERKSFKEVVCDNRGKILTGALCITTATLGYLLFKEVKQNEILKIENVKLNTENKMVNKFKETVETIQEAMSEGMIQEAIATTTRKLNNRIDIRDRLLSKGNLEYKEQVKLNKALEEIEVFERRLNAFNKLEEKYFIED